MKNHHSCGFPLTPGSPCCWSPPPHTALALVELLGFSAFSPNSISLPETQWNLFKILLTKIILTK